MNPLPPPEKMAALVSGVTQTMLGLTFVPDGNNGMIACGGARRCSPSPASTP